MSRTPVFGSIKKTKVMDRSEIYSLLEKLHERVTKLELKVERLEGKLDDSPRPRGRPRKEPVDTEFGSKTVA